jgi:predicted lipase
VVPIDWNAAVKYAKLVVVAESISVTGNDDQLKAALTKTGYTYLETLYGDELSTDIDPHAGEIVSFGFLALSQSGELVASIRGTATILEWIHDAAFLMMPCPIAGLVGMTEDGFTAIYDSLRTGKAEGSTSAVAAIKSHLTAGQAKTVTVCGHSLGGALATLLTVDVALNTPCKTPSGYTYASPRTGDHLFAQGYNASVPASYRIVNRQDLVPQLPPILPLPYEHVNTKYELNPPFGKIKQTLICMHHLGTYIWLMEQLAGSGTDTLPSECVGP